MAENPNDQILEKIAQLETRFQEFEDALDKANSVLRALQGTIAEVKQIKTEIEVAKQSNEVLSTSLNDLRQKTEDYGQKINSLMNQVDEKFQQLKSELDSLRDQQPNLESTKTVTSQETEKISQQLQQLSQQLQTAIDQQNQLKQQVLEDVAKIKNDILERTNDHVTRLETQVNSQLDQLRNQVQSQEQKLQTLSEIDEIKTTVSQLSEKTAKEQALNQEQYEELRGIIQQLQGSLKEITSGFAADIKDAIDILKNQLTQVNSAIATQNRRIERIESHLGFTVTKELSAGEDSKSLLRSIMANTLGTEKVDKYDLDDPANIVDALVDVTLHVSCAVDRSGLIDVADLILKYAGDDDSSEPMNETAIIQNYRSELLRTLEIGEAVLMELGRQRTVTRQIMQDAKNIIRAWTKKEDVQEHFPKVLELLNFLKDQYEATAN